MNDKFIAGRMVRSLLLYGPPLERVKPFDTWDVAAQHEILAGRELLAGEVPAIAWMPAGESSGMLTSRRLFAGNAAVFSLIDVSDVSEEAASLVRLGKSRVDTLVVSAGERTVEMKVTHGPEFWVLLSVLLQFAGRTKDPDPE